MYIEPYANLGHVPHCSLKIQTTIGDQYNNNTPHKNTGKTLQFPLGSECTNLHPPPTHIQSLT